MARYLRLTRGQPGVLGPEGVEFLRLALWEGGVEVDHVTAYSGAPGHQFFRDLNHEKRGFCEPIPEGVYPDVSGLEWAGAVGDYETYHSDSLGPVVAEVYGARAIMLHLDANRSYAPGSAGCVCPIDLAGLKKVVGWFGPSIPEHMEVDWGLGTITRILVDTKNPKTPPRVIRWTKLYVKPAMKRSAAYSGGAIQKSLAVRAGYTDGKLVDLAFNGVSVKIEDVESVSIEVAYRAKG